MKTFILMLKQKLIFENSKKKPSEAERINSINTQTLDFKVLFQKISIPLQQMFFRLNAPPQPTGNSRLMSYFSFKNFGFCDPLPPQNFE